MIEKQDERRSVTDNTTKNKKRYSPPQLREYGRVRELTKSSTGSTGEGNSGMGFL